MKKSNKRILLIFLIAFIVASFNCRQINIINIKAASKSTKVASPVSSKWIKSGKYQFQLTDDGILKCKIKKKTKEIAARVVSAFVYGSDLVYKTDAAVYVYEGKLNTSYSVTMKYAEGVSSTVSINNVRLAGFGKDIIYYTTPVNAGQNLLFAFDYKTATVDYVANYDYISKVYCIDKYIFIKAGTSADSNKPGCLCRIDVTTGKEKILSYNAVSASLDGKNVYWAEPADDYTYTLGIGSLKIKSCGIKDTKVKTITTLDNIDTYKTVVCMPKFVTCTSQAGTTFKYTYKNKQKTAYETYQQKELMMNANVLH